MPITLSRRWLVNEGPHDKPYYQTAQGVNVDKARVAAVVQEMLETALNTAHPGDMLFVEIRIAGKKYQYQLQEI